jgi:replicative DNA helicase
MAYTDYSTGADKVAEKAEQTILKVGDVSLRETKSFDQQTDEYIEIYKDWQQNKDRLLKTGWEIDKLLRGFRPGNFVVIGARPSIGKTMFAIDMARNFAKIGKRGVFFSLEMQHGEILERGISSSKRVRYADIRDFRVDADEMGKHAHDMKDKLRIDVIDYPRQTINQIRQLSRRIKKRNERYNSSLDFIIVDYLQLISSHNPKKSAFDIVSEVSEEMKNLAKELGVAVIALSQLSRSSSKENRMPTMSDLRQSGQIEQDADVVMLLHRDYDNETGEKSNNLVVKIEKNRAGQTGIINMYADVAYQTVFDYE